MTTGRSTGSRPPAASIKFAAVKVTEGAYYTNQFAAPDLAGAQAAGLATLGYAFAIPNGGSSGTTQFSADPKVQADDLISALPSPVPIMLDIEYDRTPVRRPMATAPQESATASARPKW